MRKVNKDTYWINNLRSYITIMILIGHACYPYFTINEKGESDGLYSDTFSILVDTNKWIGTDLFYTFVYLFILPIMFLVSGFFITNSLKKKGLQKFTKTKVKRLFYPFVLLAIPMNILGYYAGYVFIYDDVSFIEHILDFITVQDMPAGTSWFLPVLLCFSLLYAITYSFFKTIYTSIIGFFQSKNAFVIFLTVVFVSTFLYAPITYKTGMHRWFGFGPFDVQINRVVDYFFYFLIGTFLGQTNFIYEKKRANNWGKWTLAAFVFYLLVLFSFETTFENSFSINILSPNRFTILFFPITCALITLAHVLFFKKHMNFTNKLLNSLQANSYGIYIVHIVFVLWIQYTLLNINLHAVFKTAITIAVGGALSWLFVIGLRKTFRLFKEIL